VSSTAQVGEALLARRESVARAMVEEIVAEVPAYRDAPASLLGDVLVLCRVYVGLLATAVSGTAPLQREDVPIVRDHAARRLHQGIPLEAFLHAYRVGLFRCWDACAEEAARLDLPREASFALARSALAAIDTLTTHATEAYLREENRVRELRGLEARDLVERLLRGEAVDPRRRHPAAPGLDPRGELVVIVARAQDGAADALAASLPGRPLIAGREGEVVAVAAEKSARDAAERAGLRCGVSGPARGFPGVAQAYREATLALASASEQRPVVALDDLSAFQVALVGADATTRAVIAAKGAGLRDEATVRAYAAADMNVARTAERLRVHPNTVRYRLERIAAATAHDPRTFAGLVELLCVVELAREAGG
jgi:hypothetical protein